MIGNERHTIAEAGPIRLLILDEAELDAIRSHLPAEQFFTLVDQCLDQISKHIHDLITQPTGSHRLAVLAHAMIGSAGVVGARKVEAIARDLEAACEANKRSVAEDLGIQLTVAWVEAAYELKRHRDVANTQS